MIVYSKQEILSINPLKRIF